jgi:hypothetical protein
MNVMMKTLTYLQLAALCLVTALADPNSSQKNFSGRTTSVETNSIDIATLIMLVDGAGTGHASHLGQFSYTFQFVVDLSTVIGVGSAEFTAANGDTFVTEITASAVSEATGQNRVTEQHTIVGGTGRFEEASGSFTLERLVTTTGAINVSVGTIDGTIVTAKSR